MSDIVRYHDWLTLAIVFIPWSIGISVVIGLIVETYWSWLWKGMDDEKRYETIRVARW
jgi:hypothetical protein